jgi:hypothetical protein
MRAPIGPNKPRRLLDPRDAVRSSALGPPAEILAGAAKSVSRSSHEKRLRRRLAPTSGEVVTQFQSERADGFAGSNPSLSGRVGVKRFQTAPSILGSILPAGSIASLRDRHLGPPMMGSGGCGGPIYRGILAVKLTAGIRIRNGLASSIVPAGHRSTGRRNSVFSCRYCARLAVRHDMMSVTSVH